MLIETKGARYSTYTASLMHPPQETKAPPTAQPLIHSSIRAKLATDVSESSLAKENPINLLTHGDIRDIEKKWVELLEWTTTKVEPLFHKDTYLCIS